jgi:anti-sigma-K factor RskA
VSIHCDDYRELFELWALHALEPEEQRAISRHLESGCLECLPRAQNAIDMNAVISETVPRLEPPPRLRRRVQHMFGEPAHEPAKSRRFVWWPVLAALAATALIAIVLFTQNRNLRDELSTLQRQSRLETGRVAALASILQAPGTREINFGPGQPRTPRGSVFVHQQLGIVVVAGDLDSAPAGWKYETWVVPVKGNPRAIEGWLPDRGGRAISIVPGPIDSADVKAVAVSLEPPGASLAAPTKLVFAAPL